MRHHIQVRVNELHPSPHGRVGEAVRAVMAAEGVAAAAVTVVLSEDADVAGVHEEFFGDPTPTDVMTFPMGGGGTPGDPLTGELMVGAEHAGRVAAELGRSVEEEVLLYVVHGCLHLCGHDDQDLEGRRRMRERERAILGGMGVAVDRFE